MAYARFSEDSDIYLFHHVDGSWRLFYNNGKSHGDLTLIDLKKVLKAVFDLDEQGFKVPQSVYKRIAKELDL